MFRLLQKSTFFFFRNKCKVYLCDWQMYIFRFIPLIIPIFSSIHSNFVPFDHSFEGKARRFFSPFFFGVKDDLGRLFIDYDIKKTWILHHLYFLSCHFLVPVFINSYTCILILFFIFLIFAPKTEYSFLLLCEIHKYIDFFEMVPTGFG